MGKRITNILTVFLILVLLAACSTGSKASLAELLDLGEKYLLELNYEQAVVQFLKVIEVEPMNPRGYTGVAEAYMGLDQTENAIDALKLGFQRTGDNNIKDMLKELGVDVNVLDALGAISSVGRSEENNILSMSIDSWGKLSEGLWRVWGYADKSGDIVIPFLYDNVTDFADGIAEVEINGKHGLIDKNGNVVLPIEYDWGFKFINGYSEIVKDSKHGIADRQGNIIVPAEYDYIGFSGEWPVSVKKDDKSGFIDNNGKVIVPIIYDMAREFSEGFAMVRVDKEYDTRFVHEIGIINASGDFVLPLGDYNYTFGYSVEDGIFREGLAQIAIYDGLNYSTTGFIDISGNVVLNFSHTYSLGCSMYSDSRCTTWELYGDNLKYGYLDKAGNVAIPYIYDCAEDFKNGAALVVKIDGDVWKWGLINTAGDVILPIEYDNLELINGNDIVYYAEKDGKYGLYKNTGEMLLPVEYNDFMFYYTGMYNQYGDTAVVSKQGKYGIINNQGEIIIPLAYDYIESFNYELASVIKDGKHGLIDLFDKIIIPFGEYDFISVIGDELILAKKGNDSQIIEIR